MKKFLFLVFALLIALPAISAESNANVKYMNQSQGFAGFDRSLPQESRYKQIEKPSKFTADDTYTDFLNEFDDNGFRKEKAVSTEKKVIKHIKDYDGKTAVQKDKDIRPMTYTAFPKSLEDANNTMIMMPTSIPGLF